MPSVEQLLDSKSYSDESTVRFVLNFNFNSYFNDYMDLKQALLETNSETELQKATTEVKELREEENLLRQENMKLKVRFYYLKIKVI